MEIIMRCPKCQKEMETGYLGSSEKGMLIWAEKKYFDNKLCNFFYKKRCIKTWCHKYTCWQWGYK